MAIKYQWHLEFIIMYEKFGVIISRKSKNDRQYNGQKIKDKKVNNDQENTSQKTKDWSTRTPQKPGMNEHRWSGRVSSSCSSSVTRRVTVKRHEHHLIKKSCWTPVYVNKYKYVNKA